MITSGIQDDMRRINEYRQTEAMLIDVMAKGMPGKVYNLAAGDPDLSICDAVKKAYGSTDLDATHNYGPSQGLPELRQKLWRDPSCVMIADGAKQLIYEALSATTKPGDRVVLAGPCWTSYMKICEILGLRYSLLCGVGDEGYAPAIHQIEEAMSDDVCAIVINNPNNPAGYVFGDAQVGAISALAEKYDAWIIADEIYRDLSQVPVRSFRGGERAIVIDGFSKSLNLTGWRMGYCIAPAAVIKAMTALQSQLSGPPSTLIQDILIRAWDEKKTAGFEDYRERIEILCELEKFRKHRPQAGFYFYLPIDAKWESSQKLCEHMLREHAVAITPGDSYGAERTVRISAAGISADDLREIKGILAEI